MRRFRLPMLVLFTSILIVLVVFGVQLQVPTVSATPGLASFNSSSPTANTCAGCHSGSPSSGGSTSITGFPSGLTYTPGGAAIPLTVTVTDPNFKTYGFQLTARLASNIATTGGTFASTGGSASLGSGGSIQGSGSSSTFTFNWTPPTTAVGTVNFYLTGLATSSLSSNAPYTAMYTLAAGAGGPGTTGSTTLSATPASLSFKYQLGGTAPAAQTITVASSGTALSFTTAVATTTGGSWLSATPASGSTTSGTVSVSANPTGLAAGTYSGTVTIASSGATGSPITTNVTLVVSSTSVTSGLAVSPSTMTFTYHTGGSAPPSQPILISATPTALSFTATSDGTWLSATPTSGTTPGTVQVSVNPTGLTEGSYTDTVTIASSGAPGSPQVVRVTLVVSAATSTSTLKAAPAFLGFNYLSGGASPASQKLTLTTTGTSTSYSASASGGPWLSASPTSGAFPGTITVSVNPAGMSAGIYSGMITLGAAGTSSITVPVTLDVAAGATCTTGCGSSTTAITAEPYTLDPSSSGTVTALWVNHLGIPTSAAASSGDPGLLLSKVATAPAGTQAGALVLNVQGSLTELGFDYRSGGQCTATSPRFVVVTTDAVTHVVGGCSKGTATAAPVIGWERVRFNLADTTQTSPAITPGEHVSTITLVLDEGPESGAAAAGGLVVIDNIDINGTFAEKVSVGSSIGIRPLGPFRGK